MSHPQSIQRRATAIAAVLPAAVLVLVSACGGAAETSETTLGAVETSAVAVPSASTVVTTSGASETTRGSTAATGGGIECPNLTAAEIEDITGVAVEPVDTGEVVGAGGYCGNYATADGEGYLGINVFTDADSYQLSLPPEDVYVQAEDLAPIGDEAAGFRFFEDSSIVFLVARQGEDVVVVFALGPEISDDHMVTLATAALEQ